MNSRSTRPPVRFASLLALSAAAAFPFALLAQTTDPTILYQRPKPPEPKSEVRVSARYSFAPDVAFAGLGTVTGASLEDRTQSETSLITGTERGIRYDDGSVVQDYNAIELVAGSGDSSYVPIFDGATSRFSATSNDQLQNPGQIAYHIYSSAGSPDVVYDGNTSAGMGWEIAYARYFGAKRNLGFEVGFSFSGYDADFTDQIEVDLIEQEFLHDIVSGNIDPLEEVKDSEGNVIKDEYGKPTYKPVTNNPVRDDDEPLVSLDPVGDPTETTVEGGAKVEQNVDFRSAFYVFRAGPTYELDLGSRFSLNVGLGFTATFIDTNFAVEETLLNPGGGSDISSGRVLSSESEWMVGGYLDASASYQISERVSFFSGLQYLAADDFQAVNEDRTADVEFNTQIHVQAGFGIKF